VQNNFEELKRPALITLMSVLQGAGALFWLTLTGFVTAAIVSGHAPWLSAAPVVILGALAVSLQVACAIGLWRLQPWGRALQIALAGIGLLFFPVGTAVAILMLLYLFLPGVRVLFNGKPASARTPEEMVHVDAVMRPARAMIVLGGLGVALIVLVWVMIVAAIGAPFLLRGRVVANERTAIEALDSLAKAQAKYAADCGRGGFASSFDVLRTVLPDASVPSTQGFGGSYRGTSGYWILLQQGAGAASGPMDCHGVPTVTAWYAAATPQTFGSTGTRSFAINDGGGMWQSQRSAPPAEPFGPPATPVVK
jgi:hypothetical protein